MGDNLVVDAPNDDILLLAQSNSLGTTQTWGIQCQQCFPPPPGGGEFASGCSIKMGSSGLCAQVQGGLTAAVGLGSCSRSILQTFDFWTATSEGSAGATGSGTLFNPATGAASPSCTAGHLVDAAVVPPSPGPPFATTPPSLSASSQRTFSLSSCSASWPY
ncbi:hypothetical protein DFH07DRAFT_5414 [Mycena maculata]|uniref:Uncharacterized protein n=1 Tax=Mycena maculata TaxID=230809 RepID=A0AAD7KI76_9AGAR|nr:hypothetical protein DFH07DRAFT_5414 [Mycena maculata]